MGLINNVKNKVKSTVKKVGNSIKNVISSPKTTGGGGSWSSPSSNNSASVIQSLNNKVSIPSVSAGPQSKLPQPQNQSQTLNQVIQTATGGRSGAQSIVPSPLDKYSQPNFSKYSGGSSVTPSVAPVVSQTNALNRNVSNGGGGGQTVPTPAVPPPNMGGVGSGATPGIPPGVPPTIKPPVPTASERTETQAPTKYPDTPNTGVDTKKYYDSLINALQSNGEIDALEGQADSLDSILRQLNQGQGVMDENITDQPIALPFITGQKAAVERRYALQRGDVQNQQQTLEQRLKREQAKRQSGIDVAKVGLDYAQDEQGRGDRLSATDFSQQQQVYNNAQSQLKNLQDQKQQQYENTTQASQFSQKQAIDQQNANRLSSEASKSNSTEDKEITNFSADVATYIEKLGSNQMSWATAFNALKAKYPQASNELIDQMLGKDRYFTTQGNG